MPPFPSIILSFFFYLFSLIWQTDNRTITMQKLLQLCTKAHAKLPYRSTPLVLSFAFNAIASLHDRYNVKHHCLVYHFSAGNYLRKRRNPSRVSLRKQWHLANQIIVHSYVIYRNMHMHMHI